MIVYTTESFFLHAQLYRLANNEYAFVHNYKLIPPWTVEADF